MKINAKYRRINIGCLKHNKKPLRNRDPIPPLYETLGHQQLVLLKVITV